MILGLRYHKLSRLSQFRKVTRVSADVMRRMQAGAPGSRGYKGAPSKVLNFVAMLNLSGMLRHVEAC